MKNRNLPIYFGAIGLMIFVAAIGWQTAETKMRVSATTQITVPMPNPVGENANEPITNDLTFTQVKKLLAADGGANDFFGQSVAVSGNTAIVGAFSDNNQQGSAYIFERNSGGANNWSEVKKLTASDAANFDFFGYSVAIHRDTAIVSAPDQSIFSNSAGAIYIFERNAGGANNWGEVRKRTPSDGVVKDYFGYDVSISGDTIIVGAPFELSTTTEPGAAYVFERNAGGADFWGEVKKIEAIDPTPGSHIGLKVAISNDTAIISASGGGTHIVERDAGGTDNWGAVRQLTASDGAGGGFGTSVAIDGDTAIVGAEFRLVGSNNGQGAVYIYQRNNGGADNWGEVKRIVAADGAMFDRFGKSVDVSGDKIIVGASQDDIGANTDQGSAYAFERNAGGANNWGEVKKIFGAEGAAQDVFGWAVALDGNTTIVGARGTGINGGSTRGSAYVFVRSNVSWTQETKPLPANCTVEDYFGISVAIDGDTAIVGGTQEDVGANANQGAAFIFERDAGGANNWGLVKTIAATDGEANDGFGNSVAISGDRVIVGAYPDDTGTNTNQGAAYIFERNSGGANNWGQVTKLTASDGAAQDWFGYSVSISGDTAIVGAIFDNVGASSNQGSAYIYERNAGGANNWGEVKHLFASDGAAGDIFGSVGISGDTIIVGAFGDDIGGNNAQGSAYIFERNFGGANNFGEVKKIFASDGGSPDEFGVTVAIDGDRVIVGAFLADVGANNYQGAGYIYERNTGGANNWGEVKKLVASDGAADDQFGISVSISGDTAIINATYNDIGANTNQGSAYIFKQNAGGANNWGQVKKIIASDGATDDYFGFSVAVSGDTAIVGAFGDDVGGALNQGSAYIFISNNDAWNQQALISPPPPTNCGIDDQYGFSIAVSGDTAVIGAPSDDVGINANQGSVYVLERNQGGANNWGLVKLLTASGGAAGDRFGISVAISGDRIIVGAFGANNAQGAAYIFERNTGGTNNFGEVKKIVAVNGTAGDQFGYSVAINGNAVIVGAFLAEVGTNDFQGAGYIFEQNAGGANNWGQIKKLVASDGTTNDQFGVSVSISGGTAVVGTPFDDVSANANQGAVYIFQRNTGGANNWGELRKIVASDGAENDGFGLSVAVSGNTLVVGAVQAQIGTNANQGAGYIFERNTGGADFWGQVKKLTASDGAANDTFGTSVSISGDAVIVGSPFDDIGTNTDQGSAYIFEQNTGGADNWGQINKLTATDGAAGDAFGSAVAVSGDNFLVGAYLANVPTPFNKSENLFGTNQQGAGYVFRGNALAPNAASVQVGGQVLTADGRGVSRARVILTDTNGESRTALTNSFGYFRFDEVEVGQTYVFSVRHKFYQFTPQVLTVMEEISELNFTAEN